LDAGVNIAVTKPGPITPSLFPFIGAAWRY
jgi:hypothetical protein